MALRSLGFGLSVHFYIILPATLILQTKLSDREGYETRRVGGEAMPLDQHMEGGHGERQTRLKICPAPMHHLLQMADQGQHREHRLYQQAVLPLAPRTHFEIARIALRGMEPGVAQDNHAPVDRQPAREGTVAHAFQGMQEPQGDHFTGPETGMRVYGDA